MLHRLLAEIQRQLTWPPPATWTGAHFEDLSERIYIRTGTRLSVATLKRVWGRLKYDGNPSHATLDALAQFAGYAGWIDAQTRLGAERAERSRVPTPQKSTPAVAPAAPRHRPWYARLSAPLLGVFGALLILLFAAGLARYLPAYEGPPASVLRFEVERVSEGLPATVQFRYTVNGGAYDTMWVQQSWDPRLRHAVDPERGFYACTYYRPGVYAAKLLLDTAVAAERILVVPSDGWLATVEQPGRDAPLYLRGEDLTVSGGIARVDVANLRTRGVDTTGLRTAIHLIDGFPEVDTEGGFALSTHFRNTGRTACAMTDLIVFGAGGTLVLPFGKTGCSGAFTLYASGTRYGGRDYDLAGFGVGPDGDVRAEVAVAQGRLTVRNGARAVFEEALPGEFGEVLGVRWRFEGTGEVIDFALTGNGE